jgi:hypothetical protein
MPGTKGKSTQLVVSTIEDFVIHSSSRGLNEKLDSPELLF